MDATDETRINQFSGAAPPNTHTHTVSTEQSQQFGFQINQVDGHVFGRAKVELDRHMTWKVPESFWRES